MHTLIVRLPRKIILPGIAVLALSLFFCLHLAFSGDAVTAMAPAMLGKTIVIDPGHGGWDPGMKGVTGSIEAAVNLDISKKLATYCREAGAAVVMTRETDEALAKTKAEDMANRVALSQNADLFISVHCNSFPGQKGAQVFYEKSNEKGKRLAEAIQRGIREELNNTDRTAMAHADSYLLKNITCPAVICETGFLSHNEEEALLLDEDYQWKMAWAIFSGAVEFMTQESD